MEICDDLRSPGVIAALEEHLSGRDDFLEESAHLEAMWRELGSLENDIAVPAERLRSRFYAFLADERRRRETGGWRRFAGALESWWPARPQTRLALVAATLVLGVALGATVAGRDAGAEVRALREELSSVSGTVSLSLLTHPAATERLRGVSLADRAPADDRIVGALLEIVAEDPNDNVRLAAIEALAPRLGQPGVKPRLLRTLPGQDSPLVQMTLLDVLLPADGVEVLEAAEPLLRHEDLDAAVRERLLEAKGDPA